ncbi:MAG: hypothetical protein OSB58_07695 [Alphaproteobacteria bacterium]|nr:hypothetical protein [Alphaproteobacteria bacterium]
MARKPNYNFERQERDRRKADKKAAKALAKSDKQDRAKTEQDGTLPIDGSADSPIDNADDAIDAE